MKISWMIFALMVLVQWAAPVLQIQRYENVIATGELVKFKCNAPDPFDPLRGRYLVVSLADTHADLLKSESFSIGQTVYATGPYESQMSPATATRTADARAMILSPKGSAGMLVHQVGKRVHVCTPGDGHLPFGQRAALRSTGSAG